MVPKLALMPTRYMCGLSVEQRAVLGFPAPEDRYWCPETIEAVGRRYGMDMSPYIDAYRKYASTKQASIGTAKM